MSTPTIEPVKIFVRAGAGAGKTTRLTQEVVKQALEVRQQTGHWPKTILTTFTRKATQELKERLLIYCLEEAPEALEFVKSTSFLTITTMHGLFNIFLSRYGYVLGLPSQFQVVDSSKSDYWRKQIIKDLISEKAHLHHLQVFDFRKLLPNLKSFEKIHWSGDFNRLTEKDLERLIKEISQTLASELRGTVLRASQMVEGEKWEAYFATLGGMADQLQADNSWAEIQKAVSPYLDGLRQPSKSKKNPGLPKEISEEIKQIRDTIKKFVNSEEYSSQHWPSIVKTLEQFHELGQEYMRRLVSKKLSEAALEPDDLEFFAKKLVEDHPQIAEQFKHDCNAWFIDEFQDTSPQQLQVLNKLIGDQSCFVVGDPQQSIYLFRGSRSEVFFKKQQEMESVGADVQNLSTNYRTQKNLLEFINQFFTSLGEGFAAMEAHVEPLEGQTAVTVTHAASEKDDTEINNLTAQLCRLLEEGVSPKDICILGRTHKDLDRLQKKLMPLGFPVISHSSSNFFKRREILDAVSFLKILINPWDDKNLLLFLRSPWMALTDSEIVEVIGDSKSQYWLLFKEFFAKREDHQPGRILLESMELKKTAGVGWVFRKALVRLGMLEYSHKIDPTGRREANLWKIINLVEKNTREPGLSLLQLVNEGISASSLEDIGDTSDASSPVEPDKISLMTIHASKGLQFPYVFMPFLHRKPRETTFQDFTIDEGRKLWSLRLPLTDDGKFSGGTLEHLFVQGMKRREREESLRVLYVAMTRTRTKLYLSWAGKPQTNSWAQLLEPSINSIEKSSTYEYQEISEASAESCDWGKEEASLRKPWNQGVSRLAVECERNGNAGESPIKDWSTIAAMQERRWQGVVLHKIFETLKNHSPEKVLDLASTWLPERKDQIEEAVEYVYNSSELPFAEILTKGYVEWAYQKERDGNLTERRIDLWGIAEDTLWVADYKTGSVDFREKAFEQMTEYQETLKEYLSWEGPVKLAAIFPFAKQIFTREVSS